MPFIVIFHLKISVTIVYWGPMYTLSYFAMSVKVNRAHRFSQMNFLKKFLILDYRGLSVKKGVFALFGLL